MTGRWQPTVLRLPSASEIYVGPQARQFVPRSMMDKYSPPLDGVTSSRPGSQLRSLQEAQPRRLAALRRVPLRSFHRVGSLAFSIYSVHFNTSLRHYRSSSLPFAHHPLDAVDAFLLLFTTSLRFFPSRSRLVHLAEGTLSSSFRPSEFPVSLLRISSPMIRVDLSPLPALPFPQNISQNPFLSLITRSSSSTFTSQKIFFPRRFALVPPSSSDHVALSLVSSVTFARSRAGVVFRFSVYLAILILGGLF
ncbi:hypothetical protein BDY24DRAFT_78105 [Mrakia frigida]|uniref:uncharacterized protein n=1 Tax=Mrakia frigida TaxID=29902 RepID=UPI003FCBFAD0